MNPSTASIINRWLPTLLVGLHNAFMVLEIVVPDDTLLGGIGGIVSKYAYVLVIVD
jgi:hypothetical protein